MQDRYYQLSEVLAEEYHALRPQCVIVPPVATDDECARASPRFNNRCCMMTLD